MLTGGTYKGCSNNVLVELKLMVELVVVELDITDNLFFLPEIICLVPCVSRYVTDWCINHPRTLYIEDNTYLRKCMGKEGG